MVALFVLSASFLVSASFSVLIVLYLLLPSSYYEWFCFTHFVWLISFDCAFPGVGDMCHSL